MKSVCMIIFFSLFSIAHCAEKYFLALDSADCYYNFVKHDKCIKQGVKLPTKEFNLSSSEIHLHFKLLSSDQTKKCFFYKWDEANIAIKQNSLNQDTYSNEWKRVRRNGYLSLNNYYRYFRPPPVTSVNGKVTAFVGSTPTKVVSRSIANLIADKNLWEESGIKISYKDISKSRWKQFLTHPSLRDKKYRVCIEFLHPLILDVKITFAKRIHGPCKRIKYEKATTFPGKVVSCWEYINSSPKDVFLRITYVPDIKAVTVPFSFKKIKLK